MFEGHYTENNYDEVSNHGHVGPHSGAEAVERIQCLDLLMDLLQILLSSHRHPQNKWQSSVWMTHVCLRKIACDEAFEVVRKRIAQLRYDIARIRVIIMP